MTINVIEKGKKGERALAAVLREHGYEDARRGQQHQGGGDSPDVIGLPGFHLEVKRVETRSNGTIYDWLAQAKRDAKPGHRPIVVHKRNRKRWVVILDLEDDFLPLIRELY